MNVGPSFSDTEAHMPSIITFAQTDVLKDFCNSLTPVATESYIDRVSPIAEIDGVHLRTSTARHEARCPWTT